MKTPEAPHLDTRRAGDFESELRERARAWLPSWGSDDDGDFGSALLAIAARFSGEVAQRLDLCGDKMRRGFFDWLGTPRQAARPARMPVVVKMNAKAQAVFVPAPLRMSADAAGSTVTFETETDVRLLPGTLAKVVAVDADADALYVQPPGFTTIEPQDAAPDQWRLKSFAAPGETTLQVDPDTGLATDMILAIAGQQYRVVAANHDLVTIDPPVPAAGFATDTVVDKVTVFEPFEAGSLDRQFHALYVGHPDVLNIEAPATIEVVGAQNLAEAAWHYWGKLEGEDDVGWKALTLAPTQPADGVALVKAKKGSIEALGIDPVKSSRWLRASTKNVLGGAPLLDVESIALRVNCQTAPPCPASPGTQPTTIPAEAMANATPLMLGKPFYPLGLAPKQFDAFYLGCDEAFSKKGADVQLCFDLAAASFASVTAVPDRVGVFAGVGEDGALHILELDQGGSIAKFRHRQPLQPPSPAYGAGSSAAPAIRLDAKPPWRLPVWTDGKDFLVATAAGSTVWVWHEADDPDQSGWIEFGTLPSAASGRPIDGIVHLDDGAAPRLLAIQDGKLAIRGLQTNDTWRSLNTGAVALAAIAPVWDGTTGKLVTSVGEGLVGIDRRRFLYEIDVAGTCKQLGATRVSPTVRPAAIKDHTSRVIVAVAQRSPAAPLDELVAVVSGKHERRHLGNGASVIGGSLEVTLDRSEPTFLATVVRSATAVVATWSPRARGDLDRHLYGLPIPTASTTVAGAPGLIDTQSDTWIVVPGDPADIMIANFDLSRRAQHRGSLGTGMVMPTTAAPLDPNDIVVFRHKGTLEQATIAEARLQFDKEDFYALAGNPSVAGFSAAATFRVKTLHKGQFVPPRTFLLEQNESGAEEGAPILVEVGNGVMPFTVTQIDRSTPSRWSATLAGPSLAKISSHGSVSYWVPHDTNGRIVPFLELDAANGNWDAALLDRDDLVFANAAPSQQRGKAFARTGTHPTLIVLDENWTQAPPAGNIHFAVEDTLGPLSQQLGDAASNPELSWEYWNGAWSSLPLTREDTHNFTNPGAVEFTVPDDIAATDWAGKTHFWVRARLIGGDYGTETVTVLTERIAKGKKKQTIERSSDGFKPPSVVSLNIWYALCDEVSPTSVLAEDSGTIRDQSDANATSGARVEAFVPLAVSLGRMLGGEAASTSDGQCLPECDCGGSSSSTNAAVAAADVNAALPVTPATGRALFLGFDAPVAGDTVKVLLTMAHAVSRDANAAVAVQALVGGRFLPVTADDATRALGETGVLTLAFPDPPTQTTIFGPDALWWIRLAPTGIANDPWSPRLAGAYLNAVWASATETVTRELLGASEGEPNLTVTLARPPVLRGTLELRVREQLNSEDRAALGAVDPNRVVHDPNLPGDWVLWDQVTDPGDEDPKRRAYALDESTGEIRFGDGTHGKIPPVGPDAIVAFRYQRTEPPADGAVDVPANAVAARSALGLVTPVAGAEAAFAADDAAGGAPPETDERVLRFAAAKLRHRGRALTTEDLEDIALESSPDIVQARAIVRGGRTRLVVVMRGDDPTPSVAAERELTRLLLATTPAAFDPAALVVTAPKLRRLHVALRLRIDSLDHAAAVNDVIARRIVALLDPATGGITRDGWPLGVSPSADEIAAALVDVPHLLGIDAITLTEVRSDTTAPWPATLAPTELARFDPDELRVEYLPVERAA